MRAHVSFLHKLVLTGSKHFHLNYGFVQIKSLIMKQWYSTQHASLTLLCVTCFCNPLGGIVVCEMTIVETRRWSFPLFPNQWLSDSCQVMWVTVLRPPWQTDVQQCSNDTFCRATSNRGAGRAAGEATGCPEKWGHGRWDGHYTPSHLKSPFPKSEPRGDLHHSMSSAWSTHSTLHTGPRAEQIQMCVSVCFSALCLFCN